MIDRVQPVLCADEAERLLDRLAAPARPTVLSFVNQHALNLAWSVPDFASLLCEADFLLRDGVGMELVLSVLGRPPGLNMVGTTFLRRLAERFAGRRVALYGTREPWVGRAAEVLRCMGCQVLPVVDGFQPVAAYVAAAAEQAPDLIILAMGMPKQERVACAIAGAARTPMTIANGGAIADFLADRFKRAPDWVLRARLEWAYRLVIEPRRLWRRYVTGGVLFFWRLLLLLLQARRSQSRLAR